MHTKVVNKMVGTLFRPPYVSKEKKLTNFTVYANMLLITYTSVCVQVSVENARTTLLTSTGVTGINWNEMLDL